MAEPVIEPEAEQPFSEATSEPEPEIYVEPETESEVLSEPEAETDSVEFYVNIVVYSLIIFLILLLNSVILAAVFKAKLHRRNAVNIYLISLLVSRMSIGVLVVPARITGLFSEAYLGSFLCKICHYFALGSSASSVASTTAIAIIKYQQIVLKTSNVQISLKRALRDVGIIWLVGHVYALRAPIMNDLTVFRGRVACTVTQNYRNINSYLLFLDLVLLFIVPMTFVLFCYVKLVLYLSRNDQVKPPLPVPKPEPNESSPAMESQPRDVILVSESKEKVDATAPRDQDDVKDKAATESTAQKRNSINMVMIVTILFVVCTILPYIPRLYSFWQENVIAQFALFETICYQISYSNAWINAIVILIFRRDITNAIRTMCHCTVKIFPKLTNRQILIRTD